MLVVLAKTNRIKSTLYAQIITLHASNKVTDMAKVFFDKGILNRGKPFIVDTLHNILRCEKYTGIYRIHGNVYDKIYPPIVSTEVYAAAKAKIDANRNGRHPRRVEHTYLLKGKLFCGSCGRRMNSYTGTSKSGTVFRYYKCSHPEVCTNKQTVKKDVLETAITKAFEQMLCYVHNRSGSILFDQLLCSLNSLCAYILSESLPDCITKKFCKMIFTITYTISSIVKRKRRAEVMPYIL